MILIVYSCLGMAKFIANQKMMTGWIPNRFMAMFLKALFWIITPAILSVSFQSWYLDNFACCVLLCALILIAYFDTMFLECRTELQ